MLPDQPEKQAFTELLTRIASLYYLEEKTQDEVAQELGISRQKVQRLLRQAREQGIVEIIVHTQPLVPLELEKRLKAYFNLETVIVAPAYPDEQRCRQSVARATAGYLERHLSDGQVVTVGMGRNMGELPNFFHPPRPIDCTFVSAMGGSPYVDESTNPNNICQKLAANAGGKVLTLHAPAYVENEQVRNMLIAQEAINQTLTRARQADIAIVGMGMPTDDCTLVRMGCLSLAEAHRLRKIGAVGDILGDYFDENGREIVSDLHGRLTGLGLNDLRHIPKVIGVVSETYKARAVLGALHTRVLHILVTQTEAAQALLKMVGLADNDQEPKERE